MDKWILLGKALLSFAAFRMNDTSAMPFPYRFSDTFLFAALLMWYVWLDKQKWKKEYQGYGLPVFFSVCMVVGDSYQNTGSWDQCFGSPLNAGKTAIALWGYSLLFQGMVRMLFWLLETGAKTEDSAHPFMQWLFGKKIFFHNTVTILLLWLPFILLSYPGGSCVDVSYQIREVLGEVPFSDQQPLVHTLLVGGCVLLGKVLLRSYNAGLFFYICVQAVVLAMALAFGNTVLKRRKASNKVLLVCLGIYCFVPMYANFASMAIKDTLFNAFFVFYIVFLEAFLYAWQEGSFSAKYGICTGVFALLVMLFRNNGVYVVAVTAAAVAIVLVKNRKAVSLLYVQKAALIGILAVPLITYEGISTCLSGALQAEATPVREMLSVPLQQTARYAKEYGDEVTREEKMAIEAVLGEYEQLAVLYDPDIADPVKSRFVLNPSREELTGYFRCWLQQFFKHPDSYLQAALQGAYGWFYPGVSNSVRYEGMLSIFHRPALLQKVEWHLNDWYDLWDSIPVLGLLENAGCYTWLLFVFTAFIRKKRAKMQLLLYVPLYVSLLICIASPAFFLHVRYAFPIMFTMPFLGGLISSAGWNRAILTDTGTVQDESNRD